jgi:DNA repair ATPase RecN
VVPPQPTTEDRPIIERVEIRNWQALRRVDLDLGRFTVIVGPSSSGKSALMRAMRAVASNVRGTGSITRGQKSCAITVRTGDTVVALERGDGSGTYSILSGDGQITRYTKLAGGVPAQVTETLRIAPVPTGGSSINFAGQFDKPYLLDESGANVARELGELTKVNIIFEAVRNANKKRTSLATVLKARHTDLAAHTARIAEFSDLPDKLAAIAEAETVAEQAQQSADQVKRLRYATEQLALAEQVLARHEVPPVPSIEPLLAVVHHHDLLKRLVTVTRDADDDVRTYRATAELHARRQEDIDAELTDLLRRARRCPTCGQSTHNTH